jgi:hypothetical protein
MELSENISLSSPNISTAKAKIIIAESRRILELWATSEIMLVIN